MRHHRDDRGPRATAVGLSSVAVARRYFGTDGVRGVVGETLTPELVERLGRAATLWSRAERVKIGRDTRGSGVELEQALARAAPQPLHPKVEHTTGVRQDSMSRASSLGPTGCRSRSIHGRPQSAAPNADGWRRPRKTRKNVPTARSIAISVLASPRSNEPDPASTRPPGAGTRLTDAQRALDVEPLYAPRKTRLEALSRGSPV